MRRLFVIAGCCGLFVALALPAGGVAAAPVVNVHFNFTGDPFPWNICGIDGTAVDTVVEHFKRDASGEFIDNLNLKESFTATASGKSIELQLAEAVRSTAPIDNDDGTFTTIISVAGLLPRFSLPNGRVLVIDVGLLGVAVTFDADGNLVSEEFLFAKGPRPAGCDTIIAALS
jgi:hypothetical protein